jgi:hypothetical protein
MVRRQRGFAQIEAQGRRKAQFVFSIADGSRSGKNARSVNVGDHGLTPWTGTRTDKPLAGKHPCFFRKNGVSKHGKIVKRRKEWKKRRPARTPQPSTLAMRRVN